MSANIKELVKKHIAQYRLSPTGSAAKIIRAALTEQAEAFKGELAAYDGTVRELTKTVEDMRAAQSVAVVDGLSVWLRKDQIQHINQFGPALCHAYANEQAGTLAFIEKPAHSITAAELATLREKAAMVDELRKDAENWRNRHEVSK